MSHTPRVGLVGSRSVTYTCACPPVPLDSSHVGTCRRTHVATSLTAPRAVGVACGGGAAATAQFPPTGLSRAVDRTRYAVRQGTRLDLLEPWQAGRVTPAASAVVHAVSHSHGHESRFGAEQSHSATLASNNVKYCAGLDGFAGCSSNLGGACAFPAATAVSARLCPVAASNWADCRMMAVPAPHGTRFMHTATGSFAMHMVFKGALPRGPKLHALSHTNEGAECGEGWRTTQCSIMGLHNGLHALLCATCCMPGKSLCWDGGSFGDAAMRLGMATHHSTPDMSNASVAINAHDSRMRAVGDGMVEGCYVGTLYYHAEMPLGPYNRQASPRSGWGLSREGSSYACPHTRMHPPGASTSSAVGSWQVNGRPCDTCS